MKRVLHVTNLYSQASLLGRGEFIRRWVEALQRFYSVEFEQELWILPPGPPWRYWTEVKSLRKKIKDFDPHLVHVHHGLSAIPYVTSGSAKPWILSLTGSDLLQPTLKSQIEGLFFEKYLTLASKICVRNVQMQEKLLARGMKSEIFVSPIDTDCFSPGDKREARKSLGLDPNDESLRVLLFPWNPKRQSKGFAGVLQVQSALKTQGYKAEILSVYDRSPKELAQVYAAADLLVMPSRSEGSSNAIKEALACRRPVLCWDIADHPVLLGLEAGQLGPQGGILALEQPEAFVEAALQLLTRPEPSPQVLRQQIVERYGFEASAQRIAGLYRCF